MSTTWIQRNSCVWIKRKTLVTLVFASVPISIGMFRFTQSQAMLTRCFGCWNELALFWEIKQYDERCISRLLDLSYVTVVKSGLHTLSNSGLESNASKEEPQRGYYIPSMAKWHINNGQWIWMYSPSAMKERFLIWYSTSRLYFATQIWTSTPLFPFPTTVGPDSVKIPPLPLKSPSVNPTHSKHPISTD
jgi:hypothetical protein